MRYFDFTLAASPADRFNIESPGNYFFYRAASSATQAIRLRAEKGGVDAVLLPGEGVRLPSGTGLWSLETWPAPGVAVNGSVVIGTGEFFSQRFSGSVDIPSFPVAFTPTQGSFARFIPQPALECYTARNVFATGGFNALGANGVAPIAGNPYWWAVGPANGLVTNLILKSLKVQVIGGVNTALVAGLTAGNPSAFGTNGQNWLNASAIAPGPSSAVTVRKDSAAAFPAALNGQQFYVGPTSAAEQIIDVPIPDGGLMLDAGRFLFLSCTTTGNGFNILSGSGMVY